MKKYANALKKAGYEVSFAFAHVDWKLANEKLKGFGVIEYSELPFKNETAQIVLGIGPPPRVFGTNVAGLALFHFFWHRADVDGGVDGSHLSGSHGAGTRWRAGGRGMGV